MIRSLDSIERAIGNLFKGIEPATNLTTAQLSGFRIVFGALLLCYFLPSWSWLGEVPEGFFTPYLLSFAYLTDDFLPTSIFAFVDVLVIILLLFVTLGIYTRKSLVLLYIVSAVFFSYSFSFGKIDHYTNLFLFSYPVLAFTNCGTQYAIRPDRTLPDKTQRTALVVLGIIIAFGYFTAGFAKFLEWIDFNIETSGFLDWVFYCFFISENQSLLAPYLLFIPKYLFEPIDYIAVLFEISGFFFLFNGRKYWIFYLTTAGIFHLGNLLLFNLSFALNVLCYGIFLLSPVLLTIAQRKRPLSRTKINLLIGLSLAVALLKILLVVTEIPGYHYHNYAPLISMELGVDLVLWLCTIGSGIFLLRRGKTKSHPENRKEFEEQTFYTRKRHSITTLFDLKKSKSKY